MSKIEVNTVEPQCGTTLTLGACGQTVALGSGASQTGFGRTGTVDWITTPKVTGDSPITGVTGKGYFLNTTAGTITINLPAGAAGSIVSIMDYAGTWDSNKVTVSPNGSEKIGGVNADVDLTTEGQSVTFVYVDSTQGWLNTMDSTSNVRGNAYMIATGGCITCYGNDKIHTFTGPGTFTVSAAAICAANNLVSYAVVAGGGGGGSRASGGGGGGGGFRELVSPTAPYTASPLDGYPSAPNRITVTATGYPIVVGGGGAGGAAPADNAGTQGSTSTFSTISSAGGGEGGAGVAPQPAGAGGSGGGASYYYSGGAGNTPPTTPNQGFPGGDGVAGPPTPAGNYPAGGGGGATEAGADGNASPASPSGRGGAGATTEISASPRAYAGGAGGGGYAPAGSLYGAASPCGTGGAGGNPAGVGTINRGGGGGATNCATAGGLGGSGVVIIRYKFQ